MDKGCRNKKQKTASSAREQSVMVMDRSGFTLVELLMVLCVLVVLMAAALPAILRWQKGMPMEQAVSILQLQLQQTRLAAVRSGETWVMVLPERSLPGCRRPSSLPDVSHAESRFVLPAGVQCAILSEQRAAGQITCHPDGTVSGCRVELRDVDGRRTTMEIDRLTGSVRIVPRPTAMSQAQLSADTRSLNRRESTTDPELGPRWSFWYSNEVLRETMPC